VKLAREVKIQEVLVTLLTQQLEQARIAEARDTPVVQVLDRAVPSARYSRPRAARNGAIAGVIMLVLGVSLAVILENNATRRFGKR
jgi:uncharacterized protein involved in exopolysaccharide biosynthesis